jgi:hypothetical protein
MHKFFEMQTPRDLLRKLEREYDRWKADPLSDDLALTSDEQTALGRDSVDVDALALAAWALEFWRTQKIC